MNSSRFDSIWAILIAIAATTIGRAFLEFFSNPEVGGVISPWYVTLGYFLFFLSTAIGLGILIGWIVREPFLKSTLRMARLMPIVLLAPILDLIFSHGQGLCMAYIGSSQIRLFQDFMFYFGIFGHCGITPGIRIEILLVLAGIGFIIWKKTKSEWRTIVGIFLSYLFIFIQLAIPGVLGTIAMIGNYAGPWIFHAVSQSVLSANPIVAANPNLDGLQILFSQIHLLTACALGLVIWFHDCREKFQGWFKNGRWERLVYYALYIMIGIVAAGSFRFFKSWVNDISFLAAIVAVVSNFWLAVIVNDLADVTTDEISNADRPLETKIFDESSYKKLGVIFFIVTIVASLLVSYGFFLFMIAFQLIYTAYSLREIRWKKNFISASIATGSCGVAAVLAGYFLANPNHPISTLSLGAIVAALVGIGIISNFKDFKDKRGDAVDNVKTLPVLIGSKKTSLVITIALIAWSIVVAIIFHHVYFFAVAIMFALFALVSTKIKIPEKIGFAVISILMIGVMIFVR